MIPGPGDDSVPALVPRDALRVDAEPLLRLQAAEGAQAAHAAVARAREEIAYRVPRLAGHHAASALPDLEREARAIAAAAGPIGLTDLTLSAAAVADCARRNDPAALAATVARLIRLGQRAVAMISTLRTPEG